MEPEELVAHTLMGIKREPELLERVTYLIDHEVNGCDNHKVSFTGADVEGVFYIYDANGPDGESYGVLLLTEGRVGTWFESQDNTGHG